MWLTSLAKCLRSLKRIRRTQPSVSRALRRRPELEFLEDRLAPAVVGYVDDRQYSTGPENYIKAAGHTAVRLFDADLASYDLRSLNALIIGVGNGSRPSSLLANYSKVVDYVNQGGRLILHDSSPGANAAEDIVPGLDSASFVGLNSAFMDVFDPTSPVVNGPFGVTTNSSLDGGNFSNHGYVDAASLPGFVNRIMNNDGAPSQVAVLSYTHGNGFVIYTTIPAEYYAFWYGYPNWPIGDAFNYVYLPNELNAALAFNHPPTAVLAGPFALDEGQSVTLDASPSFDLDGNTLTFSWDLNDDGVWGDATGAKPALTWSQLQTFGISDDGVYKVRVQVSDGKAAGIAASTVTVKNVAPSLTLPPDAVLDEGQTFVLTGSFADPGNDTWSGTVDFGDGSGTQALPLKPDKSYTLNYVFSKSGKYTVTVTVTDDDGGLATGTVTVTVNAVVVDPTVTIVGPSDGVRGQSRTFVFQASSPSRAVQEAGFSYVIHWGDGSRAQTVSATPGNDSLSFDHVFKRAGTFTVQVMVTDVNGRRAEATHLISITAVGLQDDPANPGKTLLVVGGTPGSDEILFKAGKQAGEVVVVVNGKKLGSFWPTGGLVAFGQAGHDFIRVDRSLQLNAWLDGGIGNDILIGGRGNDVLLGGPGNDVLIDRWGDNYFDGGPGKDRIVGKKNKK
jgi:surface-anchored protein